MSKHKIRFSSILFGELGCSSQGLAKKKKKKNVKISQIYICFFFLLIVEVNGD